jgi:hypothetical protein
VFGTTVETLPKALPEFNEEEKRRRQNARSIGGNSGKEGKARVSVASQLVQTYAI